MFVFACRTKRTLRDPVPLQTQGTSHDLYWSNGDSGPPEDTDEHGQNIDDIHGTIVRITVPTTGIGYTSPSGNVVGGEQFS